MEKARVGWSWGAAAAVIVVILGVAAFFLLSSPSAKAQTSLGCSPPVTVQWQHGSVLETMIAARVCEDNRAILEGLQALAKNPEMSRDEMLGYVGNTYFKNPRLWTTSGWAEGWDEALPLLRKIVAGSEIVFIDTTSVHIEYQPYLGAATPAEDIDAIARIRFTFSAKSGDPIGEGDLKHSRVCDLD